MTTAISATTTTTQTSAQKATSNLASDFDTFLTLLTAQLQNQDPLQPMDSGQFVTQISQLTQVEQAVATNTNLEGISAQLAGGYAMNDVNYIDKNVKYAGTRVETDGTGADFSFKLAEKSEDTVVQILDLDGTLLRDIEMGTIGAEVETDVTWDGKDDQGLAMMPGAYEVRVSGKGADSLSVAYNTYVVGTVEEVAFTADGTRLKLSTGESITSQEVTAVS